jgi:hypothetical protein
MKRVEYDHNGKIYNATVCQVAHRVLLADDTALLLVEFPDGIKMAIATKREDEPRYKDGMFIHFDIGDAVSFLKTYADGVVKAANPLEKRNYAKALASTLLDTLRSVPEQDKPINIALTAYLNS